MFGSALLGAMILLGTNLLLPQGVAGVAATPGTRTPVAKSIVGELLAIDLSKSTVTIKESASGSGSKKTKQESVTLLIGASTTLTRGKREISIKEMRTSDRVLASYTESSAGKRALSIRVADLAGKAAESPPVSAP